MTDPRAQLESEWRTLTDALGVGKAASLAVFADLTRRYSEPSRFYHTLIHITHMLHTVGKWEHTVCTKEPNTVRLAIWFHDAVYDSRAKDNEEQSAQLARATLEHWDAPEDTIALTERLILATKTHAEGTNDTASLFLDSDLAVLGSDPAEYELYSIAIRQEYAWVPDADYRAGRHRVLTGFLERPRLYRTPALYDAWEARARANLRAEVERLGL